MSRQRPSLERADVAGWTPLHVAARMSRCAVAVALLKARAPWKARNRHGELPSEMCLDFETHLAFASFERSNSSGSSTSKALWSFECRPEELESPLPTPFFTPQQPILNLRGDREVQNLAVKMLNASPGHGLAFIRAAGVVHDYPRSASKFLLQEGVNAKAGSQRSS